jgi:hypothetical protein
VPIGVRIHGSGPTLGTRPESDGHQLDQSGKD